MDWTKIIVAIITVIGSIVVASISGSKERKKSAGGVSSKLVFLSVFSTLLAVGAFIIAVFWHQGPPGETGSAGPQGSPGKVAVLERTFEKVPGGNKIFTKKFVLNQPGVLLITARCVKDIPNEKPEVTAVRLVTKVDGRTIAVVADTTGREDMNYGFIGTAVTYLESGDHVVEVTFTSSGTPVDNKEVEFLILATSN